METEGQGEEPTAEREGARRDGLGGGEPEVDPREADDPDGGDEEQQLHVAPAPWREGGDDTHAGGGTVGLEPGFGGAGVVGPGRTGPVGLGEGVAEAEVEGVGVGIGCVQVEGTVRHTSPFAIAQRQAWACSRSSVTRPSA